MAAPLRVDTDALRQVAPRIAVIAAAAAASLERLASTLDAEGACWGADDLGAAFERQYADGAQRTREAFAALRDRVRAAGDSLDMVAAEVDAADYRAASRFG